MRKLSVFNLVSVDGYFVDLQGDMSWAHSSDPEFDAFVQDNAKGGGTLLFGRVTYELMASYWPTELAARNDPVVARRMNELPKVVLSRSLREAGWSNTRLLRGEADSSLRSLKEEKGADLVIMGSGSIVSLATEEGLVDEYQLVVVPLILGAGRSMFEGLDRRVGLRLESVRSFRNGNVFLVYRPAKD